jgi:GT2 family glycosyltransferase
VADASGDFVLFLFPGLFPTGDAVQALLRRLENDSTLLAVAGRWVNAKGKLEIGITSGAFQHFPRWSSTFS